MKIERKKVSMQVFEQIKEMIKENELKPGDKLPSESYFTEMFGVSRTPIREALSVLEASGLITSTQGGASIIQQVSTTNLMEQTHFEFMHPQDIVNLLETRMVIESSAASYAAKRRTEDELETIRQNLMKVQDSQKEYKIGHEEDIAFHEAIVHAAQNPILVQTMESISALYTKAIKYSLEKNIGWEDRRNLVMEEHEAIYQAIKEQKPKEAEQAMFLHLSNAKDKLVKDIPTR